LQIVARQRAAINTTKETPVSKPQTIIATLVRGETFVLKDQMFKRGVPQPVTPEVRRHLEEHAIDRKFYPAMDESEEGELREFQKFEFHTAD
jgi:hypothetical protein